MSKTVRQIAIERSASWWYCDNIVCHPEQIGLLRMDFPQVFILIRDYAESYFATFEEFRAHIAEVNFFDPSDRDIYKLAQLVMGMFCYCDCNDTMAKFCLGED